MGGHRGSCWDEAFDTLTPESAYWVGFLITDGCVRKNSARSGPEYPWEVTLLLATEDREQVEKFKEFLHATNSIVNTLPKTYRTKDGVEYQGHGRAQITVTSHHLGDRLIELGVTPKKSNTASPPVAIVGTPELARSFWRGAVDGDGSIGLNELGHLVVSFCGSRDMVDGFTFYESQVSGLPAYPVRPYRPSSRAIPSNTHFQTACHGDRARRLFCHLYADDGGRPFHLALPRKSRFLRAISR